MTGTNEICIAIVDPYSGGAMLAEALYEQHLPAVAVLSSPSMPESFTSRLRPELYRAIISHEGEPAATLARLASHRPTHVVAGFESGVPLSDFLSESLGLPSNGTALSAARRDKFLMMETVRAYGLRVPESFVSADVEALCAWIERRGRWPVVVKPPCSVASDGIYCCRSVDEARGAAERLLNEPNVLGVTNRSVLVQEFVDGDEYVVDSVSYDGRHRVTAFWIYGRNGGSDALGYDTMTLLPYEGARQRRLREYAAQILAALQIGFGPSHLELMWTAEGPVLIEIGARLTAGINTVLSELCGGISQLQKLIQVFRDPAGFLRTLDAQAVLTKRGANVFLMPRRSGTLRRIEGAAAIRELPTFHRLSINARAGQSLPRVAGMVTLLGDDQAAIDRDVRAVRALESRGFYVTEDEHGG